MGQRSNCGSLYWLGTPIGFFNAKGPFKIPSMAVLLFFAFTSLSSDNFGQDRNILRGTVTLHDKPVENILVVADSSNQEPKSALTNQSGEYEIGNLSSGVYLVSVANTPYSLADAIGETFKQVEIKGGGITQFNLSLIQGGTITGCIQYPSAQPVVGRQIVFEKTDSSMQGFSIMNFRSRFVTDDRGCFRIYGLPSGQYIVGVGKPADIDSDLRPPFITTYSPGVHSRSKADVISLKTGQEYALRKLTLNDAFISFIVNGRFADKNTGFGIPGLAFELIKYEDGTVVSMTKLRADEDGRFALDNMFQGSYRIRPVTTDKDTQSYMFDPISLTVVNSDSENLEIPCSGAPAKITGEVFLNNSPATSLDCSIALVEGDSLNPGNNMPYRITLDKGKFSISGLKRAAYTLLDGLKLWPSSFAKTNDSELMSDSTLLSFSLVSAITLALAYHPILRKLSVGLVSPYAKADMRKRALAAMADGLLVAIALFYYRSWGSPVYLFAGAAYLLFRDAVAGRSVGKFLFGLVVTNLETGRPCGWRASISRNALLLLPGANVVAAFLEASTIVRDPQGQRLGDRFALTQVVEGFGAKDLVTGVQPWLLDLIEQLRDKVRKPGRVPLKVKHRMEIRLAGPPSNVLIVLCYEL